MSKSSELIEALAAAGELASRGRFTLDREAARDKLQRFQLAEPARYVLLLVEAAVAQGATAIEARIDANDVSFDFDGEVFSADALGALWDVLLGDPLPEHPGLRPLALGLNAAMGIGPQRVKVTSGPPGDGSALELHREGAPTTQADPEHAGGTRVHVRERLSVRTVGEFLRNLNSARDEELLLRQHCRYVETAITVNGDRISSGRPRTLGCGSIHAEFEGAHLLAGLAPSAVSPPQLERCRRGVRIDVLQMSGHPGPVLAFIDDPKFALDLSQAGIRKDARYERMMERLDRLVYRMLAENLSEGLSVQGLVPGLSHWPMRAFASLYRRALARALDHGRDPTDRGEDADAPPRPWSKHPFAVPLLELPFFETLSGERRSILELESLAERRGWVGGVRSRPKEEVPSSERDTLIVSNDDDRKLLRIALRGRLRSRDAVVSRSDRRAQNRRRWERLRHPPRLGEGVWAARVSLDRDGLVGEIGIGVGEARIDVVYRGGLIHSFDPGLGIPGLIAVVEGAFTPRKTWDGVHNDRAYARALWAVLGALPELLLEAEEARRGGGLSTGLRALYTSIVGEEFGRALFRAAGFSKSSARRRMDERSGEAVTPSLDPRHGSAHPLARHPFLLALSGARVSLRDAVEMLDARGTLLWIPRSLRVPLHYSRLPPMLHLEPEDLELLEGLFDAEGLEDGTKLVQRATAEHRFLERPAVADFSQGPPPSVAHTLALDHRREADAQAWFGVDPGPIAWYWAHPREQSCFATLQVFAAHRKLETISLPAALPGILACVDFPLEALALDDDEPTLPPAGRALLEGLVADYTHGLVPRCLEDASVPLHSAEGQGLLRALIERGAPDPAALREPPWTTLSELVQLRDLRQHPVSLRACIEASLELGYVAHSDRRELAHLWPGPILPDSSHALRYLSSLTGCSPRDVSVELEQRRLAAQLASKAPSGPLRLSVPCRHEIEIEFEVEQRSFRARVGISVGLPNHTRGRVELYRERRHIESFELAQGPPVHIAMDGDFALERLDRVRRDALYEAALRSTSAAHDELLSELFEVLSDPEDDAHGHALAWYWALIEAGADQTLDAAARLRMRGLPIFELVEGATRRWVPFTELAARFSAQSGIPCFGVTRVTKGRVSKASPPPAHIELPARRAVLASRAFRHPFIERAEDWRAHKTWLRSLPLLDRHPEARAPENPLLSLQSSSDDGPVRLWLAEEEDAKVCVYLLCEGRVVDTRRPYPGLSIGGHVELGKGRLRWRSAPPETPELDMSLMLSTLDLLRSALDLARRHAAKPALTHRLLQLQDPLRQSGDSDLLDLANAIAEAPLLWTEAGWISMRDQSERGRFDAHPHSAGSPDAAADAAASADPKGATKDAPEAPVTPELRLLETIRTELRLARDGAGEAYADSQLESLGLGRGDGTRAATPGEVGCVLDLESPLVQAALAAERPHPVLVTLIASAAAGAINEWLAGVTDVHELTMCLHLTQRARIG